MSGPQSIARDIHSLEPGAIVELFDLDLTPIDPAAGVTRFHAGTNELRQPVVWQGYSYTPQPVSASGFGMTTQGAAPRPKIQISNIPTAGTVGLMTLLNRSYDDMVGAVITRRRTLVKYLDVVNFPGGVNVTADPTAEFPLDIYYVERRLTENRLYCEYELSSIYDLNGVLLPARQIIRDTCPYTYRNWDPAIGDFVYLDPRGIPVDCPYTGTSYFDRVGNPATNSALDNCGRKLSDCRNRYSSGTVPLGNVATGITAHALRQVTTISLDVPILPTGGALPFGGFPGAGRTR